MGKPSVSCSSQKLTDRLKPSSPILKPMPRQQENRLPQPSYHNPNVADTAMKAVLSKLPLHAEEDRRREIVAECELVSVVAAQGIPKD
jgi:hypothetical protein